MADAGAQRGRPEWMLTDEEMVDVRQHMSPYASPYYTELAMCRTQARKIAEWLEAQVIWVPARHCADVCASIICQFIREGKGESE